MGCCVLEREATSSLSQNEYLMRKRCDRGRHPLMEDSKLCNHILEQFSKN